MELAMRRRKQVRLIGLLSSLRLGDSGVVVTGGYEENWGCINERIEIDYLPLVRFHSQGSIEKSRLLYLASVRRPCDSYRMRAYR